MSRLHSHPGANTGKESFVIGKGEIILYMLARFFLVRRNKCTDGFLEQDHVIICSHDAVEFSKAWFAFIFNFLFFGFSFLCAKIWWKFDHANVSVLSHRGRVLFHFHALALCQMRRESGWVMCWRD